MYSVPKFLTECLGTGLPGWCIGCLAQAFRPLACINTTNHHQHNHLLKALPFQTALASNIALIGQFDPKRANPDAAPAVSNGEFTADELDAMIAGQDTAETTGSAANKGGKRRKA